MGDRSMRACLTEQVDAIRDALPLGRSFLDWYDDGADASAFLTAGANVHALGAWGYLQGAADALDLTVMEMLDEHSVQMTTPRAARLARKKG